MKQRTTSRNGLRLNGCLLKRLRLKLALTQEEVPDEYARQSSDVDCKAQNIRSAISRESVQRAERGDAVAAPIARSLAWFYRTGVVSLLATDDEAASADRERSMVVITGQCHCGAVKYRSPGPIIKSTYCDCRGCRRATGTLKAPFVTVASGSFQVIGGQTASFRTQGGERCDAHGVWHYCATCGSPLFWKGGGEEVDVFAGTLDDTSLFAPVA